MVSNPDPRVCLIILFNHKFERNLPVLRRLYSPRFSAIRFIMPFYRGSEPDVIGVYESSSEFQGYLAQAARALPREGITHYVVIGDDLLLNPGFDESNLCQKLGLDDRTGFIKSLIPLSDLSLNWPHWDKARLSVYGSVFVTHAGEIPSPDEAARLLKRHGVEVGDMTLRNLRGWGSKYPPSRYGPVRWHLYPGFWSSAYRLYQWRGRIKLAYPLLMTYSDFFVVPAGAVDNFLHYCGVFAALGTFVETAIPTSLAMACERVRVETDTPFHGGEYWTPEEGKAIEERYGLDLQRVLDQFPPELIHLHPIKLSRWSAANLRAGSSGQGVGPAGAASHASRPAAIAADA
jgi:hypothetical protein